MIKSSNHYDLLVVGGGIAGSVLARTMALEGFKVLVIEKETKFKDRIRGEVLLPWGTAEAQELGIYQILLDNCAKEAAREYFYYSGKPSEPRDFRTSTPKGTCTLSFFHPEMQEVLLGHAALAGAEVWRDAVIGPLRPGTLPEADIIRDGKTTTINARLIVGADGRESQVATLLGFVRTQDPSELFTGGLQLEGDLQIEHALYFFLHAITGRGSILIQNGPRSFRTYLLHHKDALQHRLSGARDYDVVMRHFREIGVPGGWLDSLTPKGIFATFDGAHRWITNPIRGNCVLIGDAAAASDPVWGNGLSRTLRDVRLLRDRLLQSKDWSKAAPAYASDHDDFFHRLRQAERLNATLHFSIGEIAEERRRRAYALMDKYPELNPDMAALGPEARCNDHVINTLLGQGIPLIN